MAVNQYLAFGVGVGANTLTPATYSIHPLVASGHLPGIALSEVANTTWRQVSVASAGLAQLVVEVAGLDMLDDGSVLNYKNGVLSAIRHLVTEQQFWAPGDVKGSLTSTIPAGWLLADGRVVSRGMYASLFAAIGTQYGAGDGLTTFGLPDLRGEFLRGLDAGRGVDAGRVLGSTQAQQTAKHQHTQAHGEFDAASALFGRSTSSGYRGSGGGVDGDNYLYHTNDGTPYGTSTPNAAGVIGDETRPRNVAVQWLIKT